MLNKRLRIITLQTLSNIIKQGLNPGMKAFCEPDIKVPAGGWCGGGSQ